MLESVKAVKDGSEKIASFKRIFLTERRSGRKSLSGDSFPSVGLAGIAESPVEETRLSSSGEGFKKYT